MALTQTSAPPSKHVVQPVSSLVPRDPLLWLIVLFAGGMLTWLSLARYWGFNAGMLDLGAMAQAIFSVPRGLPLETTGANGNFSRLAGHVELFYLLFVPPTLLWRDPQVLLIAQALIAVSAAIPVYRLALRRLESLLAARCAALIYLFYPVMQTAVLFDLHGDTLAMPLLLWAVDALDRRAWRSYTVWIALALTCKVYVALPVALLGGITWLWGAPDQRRAGLFTGIAGFAYGAFTFFVVRELFAPPDLGESVARIYTSHYFGDLQQIFTTLPDRALNAVILFLPVVLVAWRGWRWLLPGLPVAAAVLLSTGPGSGYDFRYHHYALVVPFLVLATIDGAARRKQYSPAGARLWRADLIVTTLIVLIFTGLLVDTPLNPQFWTAPPGRGLDHAVYGRTERDAFKDRWLAEQVPPDAPIAASMFLAPRLVDRDVLYAVRYPDDPGGERLPTLLPQVEYVVADALFDWRLVIDGAAVGGAGYERAEIAALLRDPAFALVHARDGLLLFARDGQASALAQEIAIVEQAELAAQPRDFGPVQLLGAAVTPLGDRRYQAEFEWRRTAGELSGPIVAVSRLDGVDHARIPHVPSYSLLNAVEWAPGAIVRERFVIEVPLEVQAGRYTWMLGWYSVNHPEGHATDARSLLPGSAEHPIITLEVTE
jgi:uncharacterized membrane protein